MSYPSLANVNQLMEECAINLYNNKFNNVYDFNTQYSGKSENNYQIVAKKNFYEMLDEYKMVVPHADQSKLDYIGNQEMVIPYKSHKQMKNQDTFLVMLACKDQSQQALKLI